ncbi:MAG: lipid asymmetry maintenance ABC transporter permease subunit MlaE [Lautropia sp.]|nr:lipid asymmetry maintenance ABC transporter permease subunit MlaE [Lautropia sp.]
MLARLGRWARQVAGDLGFSGRFLIHLLWRSLLALRRPRLIVEQIYFVGNRSLSIILISGLFVGFVLGLQGYYNLQRYGAESSLGLLVALSLLRELGPVVAALLFAGRACTSITAGIGLMKSGEQLIAMEMMGVDPMQRVLAPRFMAVLIALPILALLFSAVGIVGAWVVGVQMIGVDPGSFWSQMQAGVSFRLDVLNGVVAKSVVFAALSGFIALAVGHESEATPEGVARATTTTVVISSLAVLASDVLMTALMFGGL